MPSDLIFYYHPTPNPSKVALFLEEAGLTYQLRPIDILRGQQHTADFAALNPNRKLPVLVDGGIAIFDSTAILLHLVRKTGEFGAVGNEASQAELLSWLMLIASGVGPFTGQAIHFKQYAPAGQAYATHRYNFEAARHWALIDERLQARRYLLGDHYSAADISLWGWGRGLRYWLGADEAWQRYPHVARWFQEIDARPAAQRASALASRHSFKQDTDDETRASLFRHGVPQLTA